MLSQKKKFSKKLKFLIFSLFKSGEHYQIFQIFNKIEIDKTLKNIHLCVSIFQDFP